MSVTPPVHGSANWDGPLNAALTDLDTRTTAQSDHGNLAGLGDDDHPQYDLRFLRHHYGNADVSVSLDPNLANAQPAATYLSPPTPDGTGKVVHPSMVFIPEGWNGHRYWAAYTPYAGSNNQLENPCIAYSDDGSTWTVPAGLTNPLESPPASGYNSDTHLVVGPDNRLYCIWRSWSSAWTGSEERIFYRASSDGVDWSDKQTMLTNAAATRRLVSPAVFWDGNQWVMYAVDFVPSPNTLNRLTAASLTGPWSAPSTCTIAPTLPSTRQPWHLDAKMWNGTTVMVLQDTVSSADDGSDGDLYLLTSSDGTTFTRGIAPLMAKSAGAAVNATFYRSSFVPGVSTETPALRLWYGSQGTADWRVCYTEVKFDRGAQARNRAANIQAARVPIYPYTAGDCFARADGALGTADSGQTWTTWAGTPDIVSQQARASTAANTKAVIDAGVADGYFEVAFAASSAAAGQYIVFRGVDTSNYWRYGLFAGSQRNLEKVVAGSVTGLYSYSAPSTLFTAYTRFGVLCRGNEIAIFQDDQFITVVTDSAFNTATLFGYQCSTTDARFDEFWSRRLVNGA